MFTIIVILDIAIYLEVIFVNVAKPLKLFTLEEFEQMEKDMLSTYELIDGAVMMSPRPALKHQLISANLHAALSSFVKKHGCHILSEIELLLEENCIVPDLSIICDEVSNFMDSARYQKPPLIVIEIVSASSISRDYMLKRHKYGELGVQEYWIVSPDEKCIWVVDYTKNEQHHYCNGQVHSEVLPGLEVEIGDIFI